jgi:hypothetical protein
LVAKLGAANDADLRKECPRGDNRVRPDSRTVADHCAKLLDSRAMKA